MKKIAYTILSLIALLIASCSEDFNTAAPYKTVTIVYGMLDIADTAHYIRIQKAFLDQTKSAVVMAQVPDSNYFSNLNVKMKVLDGSSLVNTITLNRVDLNLEGYPKASGSFATSPSYAYKFTDVLNSDYTYRLVVYNPATGETDSAESPVISNADSVFKINLFSNTSYQMDISRTDLNRKFSLVGVPPPNGIMFEGILRFHWTDRDNGPGTETTHFADWDFEDDNIAAGAGTFNLSITNAEVYSGIRNTIGVAETGHTRYLDSVDIIIWSASQELYNYKIVSETQANSITSDEVKPNYTNVKGKNTLGLFASRTMVIDHGVTFTSSSIDSLIISPITAPCNIQKR